MAEKDAKHGDMSLELKTKEAVKAIDDVTDPESTDKKYPYPKSIAFIVSNELCERFSFYGMRTILVLFLVEKLKFSDDTSTVIYHSFIFFVYFFPIVGAIIADSWLGRFKTIIYLSIIYAIGSVLIALTAIEPLHIPDVAFSMIALLFIAVGSGGIKPNVSAFGGDQFKIPEQAAQLAVFFSIFYFAINTGSLVSTFLTPILRADVHCFGSEEDCYPLAFGVPGILMILSIILFVLGKPLYIIKDPSGNIILDVMKCIFHAIGRKWKAKKDEKRDHWLDYADDKYDKSFISDIQAMNRVLVLFIPLPIFWALFDQQGSRWTLQAKAMNGALGSIVIKPDQVQLINPLLILVFIPIFEVAIYPALEWCKIIRRPLHKMIIGGLLAGISFLVSGFIQLKLDSITTSPPGAQETQIRLYNGLKCDLNIVSNLSAAFTLKKLGYHYDGNMDARSSAAYSYEIPVDCDNLNNPKKGHFYLEKKNLTSYFITNGTIEKFYDNTDKSYKGQSLLRILKTLKKDEPVILKKPGSSEEVYKITNMERAEVKSGMYDLFLGDRPLTTQEIFEKGAVYTIVVNEDKNGALNTQKTTITPAGTVHMLWLIPQYIIITMGEVMFSITGLEFSYSQAPLTMKSVLTAGWLLTVAFGNLIVVIIAEIKIFESQANEFFLFAGLMIVDMIIFAIMAFRYKYVEIPQSEPNEEMRRDKLVIEAKEVTAESS